MTLQRSLYLIALPLLATLAACQNKERKGRDQFDPPALHQPQTVTLARRTRGEPDNYKEACLFLNESFRRNNTCALSVQTDMSLYGVQAGGQIAQLSRGIPGQNLSEANWPGERARGEVLKASEYKVGDLWFLRKADGRTQYELAFEIVRIEPESLTIRYEVKSFSYAGR